VLGRSILLFDLKFDLKTDQAIRQQLAVLGDVRTPSIAELFVAMLSDKPGETQGAAR
jgi:hypothetical protein